MRILNILHSILAKFKLLFSDYEPFFLLFLRLIVGFIFIRSGFLKIVQPLEYFQVSVNSFDVVPAPVDFLIAYSLPWTELFVGLFLSLGLFQSLSAFVLMINTFVFQVAIGQAIIRKLPIEHCGCFGGEVKLSLYASFALDTVLLFLLIYLSTAKKSEFSLDSFFEKIRFDRNAV